jgi:hypothetical protein
VTVGEPAAEVEARSFRRGASARVRTIARTAAMTVTVIAREVWRRWSVCMPFHLQRGVALATINRREWRLVNPANR